MIDFIKMLPPAAITIISIALTALVIAVVVGVWMILKHILTHIKKVEILGNKVELSNDNNEEIVSQVIQQQPIKDSFQSVIFNILGYATDTAYEASTLRQTLYDDQLRSAKSKFSMIKTLIVGDYSKNHQCNVDLIDIIFDNVFDIVILSKLEKIFQLDRMTERSKDSFIALHKSFIDESPWKVQLELRKLIGPNNSLFDSDILVSLSRQEDLIKKSITEVLEYSYDESLKYINNLNELNIKYSSLINNTLKSYFNDDNSILDMLPEKWNDTVPPNSVVGEV